MTLVRFGHRQPLITEKELREAFKKYGPKETKPKSVKANSTN